ncbi:MAG TPA: PAS domain S-box protein [Rhizomicrobium sp.]|nr:PAS domain S-box protein [Rhizomicrobium sp.]
MPTQGIAQIANENALFRALIDTAIDGIMVIDEKARIQVFNPSCERLFGYAPNEVLGRNVDILMPEPFRSEHDAYIRRYLKTREPHIIGIGREVVGRRKDGSTFPMYLSVGEGLIDDQRIFVGIVNDTSERRARDKRIQELQGELLHVTRMTAMGEMTSALAHEINQPLTALLNYTSAARHVAGTLGEPGAKLVDILNRAIDQAERAGLIIRRLRNFIEKREPNRVEEDINKVVEDAVALALAGVRDSGIKWTLKLQPNLPPVLIDKVQIQQILVNLVRNAIEAMTGMTVKQLTLQTRLDGDEVEVSVKDSGHGVQEDVVSRLFHPFVTTKENGMGMGLSICRKIAEAHGGHLWLDENSPKGATFILRLPVVEIARGDE